MKWLRLTAMALFVSLASLASANSYDDYTFSQERMVCADNAIYIISSFDDSDNVTSYSYNGDKLWDRSFFAKITSWQIIGNYIVVFSKHRSGYKTYLSCLNRFNGDLIWQRP